MGFPRLRKLFSAVVVFLLLLGAVVFLFLQSDSFWEWAGPRLVQTANGQLRGALTVGEIRGNPFSGYFFRQIELTSPAGKVLQARELEVRVSLFSLLALRPSLRLTLVQPRLSLSQDPDGRWNLEQLLRPRQGSSGGVGLPLAAIHLEPLQIKAGEVTLARPGGSQRYHDLNLNLDLTLFRPFSPRRSLRVEKLTLGAATPWGPYRLDGGLTFKEDRVRVESLVLKSGGHRLLSLSGAVPLSGGKQKVQVTGLLGPIPGEIIARFWAKWPPAWEAAGKLQVAGPRSNVRVGLQGLVHQAAFSLEGVVGRGQDAWNYDLVLKIKDLPPEMLALLDPAREKELAQSTPLSARLQLQGEGLSWPPREFAWNLRLEPLTYRRVRLEQGQVTFSGTAKEQKLAGSLQGNFGRVALQARGSFFTAPRGSLTLEVEEFRPGLLGLEAPEGTLLTGKFAGKVAVPDPARPAGLSVSGELQAAGRIGAYPLREVRARFAWARPRLTLQEMRVQLGNLRAELRGTWDGMQVQLTHRGRSLPGGDWPVPAALGGALSWEGSVTGPLVAPAYGLRLNGRHLSWGKIDLKSLALKAQGQGWPPRAGTVDLQAQGLKTPAGTFSQVHLASRGGDARWRFNFTASSTAQGPRVELAGTGDFSSRPLALGIERLHLRLPQLTAKNQGPVQVRFLPGLELAPATFLVNGGSVTAQASLQDNQVSGLLTLKDLPAAITRVKGLHGQIQARLSLTGTAPSPMMEGQIGLTGGKWREFAFPSFKTSFNYRNASLTFNGGVQEAQKGGRLSWNGRLPLRLSLQPWRFALADEEVDLKLRGEGANLALLTIVTQEVQKADAPLDLQAEVQGRLSQPRSSGQLRWGAGRITLRQAGAPYQLLPGSLRWDNNRLTLSQLTFKKQGTARLTADVALEGLQPRQVTARAQLDDFQALDKLGSEAFINGVVNLTGPWSALVLDGRLTIPRASLNPALLKQGGTELPADYVLVGVPGAKARKAALHPPPDPYQKMKIAISLEAAQDVRVMDKMANIEVALDLRIKKRPGAALQAGGVVRSLEGKIDVYGKEFTLERGLITLPGVPGQEPYLQARAIHQMTDAIFIVDVTGPVNNPQINLSSSPAMPPNELLSYLIFDRPTSTLNKAEFDVTQQAVGVLGGITARKIQEFLGKDFPVLGDVSLKGSQGAIGVTKPLTKDVTLSVERKLNPAEGDNPVQLRLQYRINRHFSLEAEGGQSRTGADALFNYEW
jgi:translocation and assembly module TamB